MMDWGSLALGFGFGLALGMEVARRAFKETSKLLAEANATTNRLFLAVAYKINDPEANP